MPEIGEGAPKLDLKSQQLRRRETPATNQSSTEQALSQEASHFLGKLARKAKATLPAVAVLGMLASGELSTPTKAGAAENVSGQSGQATSSAEQEAMNDPTWQEVHRRSSELGQQERQTKLTLKRAQQEENWVDQVNKFHELGGLPDGKTSE